MVQEITLTGNTLIEIKDEINLYFRRLQRRIPERVLRKVPTPVVITGYVDEADNFGAAKAYDDTPIWRALIPCSGIVEGVHVIVEQTGELASKQEAFVVFSFTSPKNVETSCEIKTKGGYSSGLMNTPVDAGTKLEVRFYGKGKGIWLGVVIYADPEQTSANVEEK